MSRNVIVKCETCHFYEAGECRANPPSVELVDYAPDLPGVRPSRRSHWPIVKATDFCGSWRVVDVRLAVVES